MEPAVINKINTSPTLVGRERNEWEKNEFTLAAAATAAKRALSACRSSEVHTSCYEEEEEEDEEEEEEEEEKT
jgi:uncharacterized protein YgiB involved in biofilm formation